jgi:hypothetical protein
VEVAEVAELDDDEGAATVPRPGYVTHASLFVAPGLALSTGMTRVTRLEIPDLRSVSRAIASRTKTEEWSKGSPDACGERDDQDGQTSTHVEEDR